MNKIEYGILGILIRYPVLILSALFNLEIFYIVFTPLTIYPVYYLLKFFFDTVLIGNVILVSQNIPIEMIKSCIAGSAYYLLLILNLSIPNIKIGKRIWMIFLSFLSFLVLNIIRVIMLVMIFMYNFAAFDVTHKLFWYALSTIFVVGIWFAEVKIFRINEIPVYSDMKFLLSLKKIKKSKRSKKH